MPRSPQLRVSLAFLLLAVLCLPVADLRITTLDPWLVLGRLAKGIVTPSFTGTGDLVSAVALTVGFAVAGVALGSAAGLLLSFAFHLRPVRLFCAGVRSVHELFWALMLMTVLGPTALTGLLAIAVPYAGIFAKVYAEILDEGDRRPLDVLPPGSGAVSAFLFARLPDAFDGLRCYTAYRLECGMRSSAVLGFVGLPTIGFHLESYFKQGHYSQAAGLLFVFYGLIATVPLWARRRFMPVWLLLSLVILPWATTASWANVVQLLTYDIVPAPLRAGRWDGLWEWGRTVLVDQALPGAAATLVLGQIALAATGLWALLAAPLLMRRVVGRWGAVGGHLVLVVARSTPEYMLAFVLLQLWGPSMLPAAVALALHNGAIIGHLVGRQGDGLATRPDAPRGVDFYAWEALPRSFGQMLAFLFYRWEIILRETAILGILGVHTLGFYVDSAIAELRLDRALVLIVVTAGMNMSVDALSRRIRQGLRLSSVDGRCQSLG